MVFTGQKTQYDANYHIGWHPLDANQYDGPSWQTGTIFSCCKGLWDCLVPKPITTKHQSVRQVHLKTELKLNLKK